MPRKPEPIDGENAEAAEARLKNLRGRFSKVSGNFSTRRGEGKMPLSPFEVAILAGVGLFVVAVAVQVLG